MRKIRNRVPDCPNGRTRGEVTAVIELMTTRRIALILASLLLLGSVAAQAVHQTGTVDGTIDGSAYHAWTYATDVPEDVADGVEDEAVRAILTNIAGTTQHSATFNHMDAMTLGSIELMPATIFVTMLTRTEHPDGDTVGTVEINFSLQPETLELASQDDVVVKYHPGESSFSNYYALTSGGLELQSIEVVDEQTLAITGTISGQFSWQEGYETVHDPATAINVELTFVVNQVVSSSTAFELITGE